MPTESELRNRYAEYHGRAKTEAMERLKYISRSHCVSPGEKAAAQEAFINTPSAAKLGKTKTGKRP